MPRSLDVVSRWHHSVENLNVSALEFYDSISKALSEKAAPVHIERIEWHEGGLLSAKRKYLRLTYNRHTFDICAFPFGRDYYFSWWSGKQLPEHVMLFGCGLMFGLPVAFLLCIAMAGFGKGIMLFLLCAGIGLAVVMGNAQSKGNPNPLDDLLLGVPVLGVLYQRFVRPTTYYTEDTRVMFEETVHRVVLDVVTDILTVHSLPALSPEAQKPTTRPLK